MALCAAALVLSGCTGSGGTSNPSEGGTETFTLRLASYQPPGAAEALATQEWASQIEEATDDRVQIEFFFQEGLLPGAETLAGVADGRADLGYIADAYYPGELPLTTVAGIPFVTSSPEAQGRAFIDLYENNEAFKAEWERLGVRPLIWAPVPPNGVAVKEPAKSLSDLAGRKIRVIGYAAQAYEAAGITPVAISQSEVYESLQRGVVDGTSGASFDILTDRDYQEVAPHFMDLQSGNYAVTVNVINQRLWDRLPADIQDTILEVSEGYLDLYLEKLIAHEDQACTKLQEAGGSITILPQAEVDAWAATAGPKAKESWVASVNNSGSGANAKEFFNEYLRTVEKHEASAEYVPAMQRCAAKL